MYLAKQSGKGHHEVFQIGMRQEMIDRLELRVDLPEALGRNEFVLHYQPIVWSIPVGRSVSKRCCDGSIRAAAASSRCSSSRLPKRPN